jgi:surface polysaccharide O-acyltransferase-like enzyme
MLSVQPIGSVGDPLPCGLVAAFYILYFLAAVCIGVHGIERGPLSSSGTLARHWAIWVCAAALSFALLLVIERLQRGSGSAQSALILGSAWGLAFALACGSISFAMLALFLRFGTRQSIVLRGFQQNAYGIYVVHFVFVVWLQYLMIGLTSPATAKFVVVSFGATALSWICVAFARRSSRIARFL